MVIEAVCPVTVTDNAPTDEITVPVAAAFKRVAKKSKPRTIAIIPRLVLA